MYEKHLISRAGSWSVAVDQKKNVKQIVKGGAVAAVCISHKYLLSFIVRWFGEKVHPGRQLLQPALHFRQENSSRDKRDKLNQIVLKSEQKRTRKGRRNARGQEKGAPKFFGGSAPDN